MSASADYRAPEPGQRVVRTLLRLTLRALFRGLVRPPMPIAGQRAVLRALTAATLPVSGVSRDRGVVGGRPCEWHRPDNASGGVLLYLHGGAYLAGSPATHRAICAQLARLAGLDVCALDYRLAPEHRFPAARDDAVAAFLELLTRGYPPQRIALGGDSAGGHLTLVTALRLRELGVPTPAALVCLSPLTDTVGAERRQPPGGDPLLHPRWLAQASGLLAPPGFALSDPALSPLHADLAGLPPTLLQVGEDELLLQDSLRLADRAREAGVDLRLERYPALWHVFQIHAGILRAADQALARVATFLNERGC